MSTTSKSFIKVFTLALLLLGGVATTNAQSAVSQVVNLAPGWNIVSTPMVLSSHSFSAAETATNFDIYVLDASKPTGWATMADLGQTKFTPLFGYFINNKTGSNQTLTFNFATELSPNQKLFERTFSTPGWYSIGVANSAYATPAAGLYGDTNNPSRILSLLDGSYNLFIDMTSANYASNRQSVSLTDPWKVALPENINSINDLRETKGYVVYITKAEALYSGVQGSEVTQPNPGGAQIELKVVGDVNLDPTPISVYDSTGAEEQPIMLFRVENESDTDVSIKSFSVELKTTGVDVNEFVKKLYAEGAYSAWSPTAFSTVDAFEDGETVTVTFENFNLNIEAWEEAMIMIKMDAYSFGGNFTEGDTLTITTDPTTTGWVSVDEFSNPVDRSYGTGTAEGGPYTAILGYPISIPADQFQSETDTVGDNDQIGVFTLEFEVEATNDDYYITDNSAQLLNTPTDGVGFIIDGPASTTISSVLSSSADESSNGVFEVQEGRSETFTLTVTIDPNVTGQYRVTLGEVWFSPNINGVTGAQKFVPFPAADFRTSYTNINAN